MVLQKKKSMTDTLSPVHHSSVVKYSDSFPKRKHASETALETKNVHKHVNVTIAKDK